MGEDRSLCEGCKHCIAITTSDTVLCAYLRWTVPMRYCRFYKPKGKPAEGEKDGRSDRP